MKLNIFFDRIINESNHHSNIPKDFLYKKLNVIKGTVDTVFNEDSSNIKIDKIIDSFKNYILPYSNNKKVLADTFIYRVLGISDPGLDLYPVGITDKAKPIWKKILQNKKVIRKMENYEDNTKAKWAVAIVFFYDACLSKQIKPFKRDVML